MGIDNCVIFSVWTIADNWRCFLSYCVIVLSDRDSVLLQRTPATHPFTEMLMQTQEHIDIIQHNKHVSHLLALYSTVIIGAYVVIFYLFKSLRGL